MVGFNDLFVFLNHVVLPVFKWGSCKILFPFHINLQITQ